MKDNKFEIRVATIDNLTAIQELNLALFVKENKEFDPTVDPKYPFSKNGEEYFIERILRGCALIAVINNEVIGYLLGAISEADDYRNIENVGEIETMFVIEKYRSMGIGNQLFEKFFSWAKAKGVRRVRIVASAQNIRAIRFYEKKGLRMYDVVLEGEI